MHDMGSVPVTIIVYEESFAICRLSSGEQVPSWCADSAFLSVSRSPDELSIVCLQRLVPDGVRCSRDWALMRIDGVLDLQMTGVLSGLLAPLSGAGVNVFTISTYDTDYILVPRSKLEKTRTSLSVEGHHILDRKISPDA